MRRWVFTLVVAALLVAAGLSVLGLRGGLRRSSRRSAGGTSAGSPNIVVIVMDTARRDRLSCYGYPRATSPRLDGLADESTIFTRAYSTSSWTSPAHASLFTGLYPASHAVTQEHWRMNQDLVTLAEVLSEHGYDTIGIIENAILSAEHGFAQGFSEYHVTARLQRFLDRARSLGRSETGNLAADRFLESIRARGQGSPFFVFVNLIAPHQPYDSSGRFMGEFLTDEDIDLVSNMWPEYYLGLREFTTEELRHLNELYDAELLYTDHLVGLMMDGLKEQGLWEDTVFIVTSDHGENIGDHDHMDHVFSLYGTTVRIPLVIHGPDWFGQGASDDRPISIADLFPTILEIAAVDTDSYGSQGLSLLSDDIPHDRAIVSEYYWPAQALGVFSEEDQSSARLDPHRRRIRSIIVEDRKLVWGSDGRHELYDLTDDPHEQSNLLQIGGQRTERSEELLRSLEARLLSTLEDLEEERPVEPAGISPAELSEETREALRSLGYLR